MADLQRVRSFSSTVLKSPPHLILRTEAASHQLLLDVGNCWTFGRGSDNTFTLPDRWASRSHAMLQRTDDGEYYLIDLGSRNGTFVNGRRVSIPVRLRHSDRLTVGQTDLVFYSPMQVQREESLDFDTEDGATAVLSLRRLISVMVVDIRQFTVLTRQLDEQVLSELIGTWFRQAGNIIRDAGSWVDKYIGDAVMAVFGVPIPHSNEVERTRDAQSAVAASLAIARKLAEMNEVWVAQGLPPVSTGIGINSGLVIAGSLGSSERLEYSVLGDAVNVASRLESFNKEVDGGPHHILISEETHRRLDNNFQTEFVGKFALKGKTQETGIYRVLDIQKKTNQLIPNHKMA